MDKTMLKPIPQSRVLWNIPESIPRQKAFLYSFLLFFTVLLLYFYSYPLNVKNWTYTGPIASIYESIYKTNTSQLYDYDSITDDAYSTDSILLQILLSNQSKVTETVSDTLENEESLLTTVFTTHPEDSEAASSNSEISSEKNTRLGNRTKLIKAGTGETNPTKNKSQNDLTTIFNEKDVEKSSKGEKTALYYLQLKAIVAERNHTEKQESSSDVHAQAAYQPGTTATNPNGTGFMEEIARTTLQATADSSDSLIKGSVPKTDDFSTLAKNAATGVSGVENGFLVFSKNCRIPDLDPMHPSILHLIEKEPPLDCSEGHKPLTSTEGNFLQLNLTAVRQRTSGNDWTCCHRSVFRDKDGLSDDKVGFGKCIDISYRDFIKDEFIEVECKHGNGTSFYKEFHSFIHDKPEVEKRCNKLVETTSPYSILIIGADAMSRINMHRQLNATARYLLKEMGAIEMFGYNKVGDNTFPNLIPLLVGYDEKELPSVCWKSEKLPLDRCNFLWKEFSAKGYRTFYAEDVPHISSFNYLKEGFLHQPTDYYFRHFILAYEEALGRNKPLNCHLCVGSISETEAVLNWAEKFAAHFADRPYFAFSWINSLTHDFLNKGSSGDHMYKTFFSSLHQSGALRKTIVILMGDHGMRWGEIRKTYIGRLEERLPMLMIALPQDFKNEYSEFTKALQLNAHRLTTPFDLHATLEHILNLRSNWSFQSKDKIDSELANNFTKRAQSLFHPVPEDRSCDDAFVEEHWCTCETSLEADIASDQVKEVAGFLVHHVNSLLKPVSDKCTLLKLDSISDARLWQPQLDHKGHTAEDNIYTVVVHTKPGGAVFEGTVKVSGRGDKHELLGTISRLNLYRNQSACMDNAILRKYCYCL